MTTFEIILLCLLAAAVVWIVRLYLVIDQWRSYARRLKSRAETAEFFSGVLAVPAALFAIKAAKQIRDHFRP